MSTQIIGIIGGSGLYEMEGLQVTQRLHIETPFGKPSDAYIIGELEGQKVVFLPRHGRGHLLNPSELNFRANIWGFKKLGVSRLLSVSAVGSLKEEIKPGHMVVIDQFVDRTQGRHATFFQQGIVGHIGFADPVCGCLRQTIIESAKQAGATVHEQGTYVCIEGPQFSTRAESELYRSWGMDVIGMTNLQEAKLAREAEICYATLALSTDYDCWHPGHDDVTIDQIVKVLHDNVAMAKKIIRLAIPQVSPACACSCQSSLQHAILTDKTKISADVKNRLALLISKYV